MNEHFDEEFDIDIEADEITLDIDMDSDIVGEELELPKVYLHLENLVLFQQVRGLVEDAGDKLVVDAYADKDGELKLVGLIELTAENVLSMQHLGLKVTLVRQGKDPILFNKAEDYMSIVKTLKSGDTVDIDYDAVSDDNDQSTEG